MEPDTQSSLRPTRKWFVAQVTALCGIAIMWATTGTWDTEETVAAITWFGQATATWLTPNLPTPGGVPLSRRR
jgi:hypothetical protein